MPRNSEGQYSLPAGTIVADGETILVSQHNPGLQDIAQALTNSLDRAGSGGMLANLAMGGFKITGLAEGTDPTDAATVSQLVSGGAAVPTGTVLDFAGSSAPEGYLLCGGQSISRVTYAALFAVIGTTYGSASGSTFNLPDCRGRLTAGKDFDQGGLAARLSSATMTPDGQTLGAVGGAQTVALTTDQMPSHTHAGTAASNGAHTHTATGAVTGDSHPEGGGSPTADATSVTTSSNGAHTHTLTIDNAGGGGAHGNVQPTILLNKIIKV